MHGVNHEGKYKNPIQGERYEPEALYKEKLEHNQFFMARINDCEDDHILRLDIGTCPNKARQLFPPFLNAIRELESQIYRLFRQIYKADRDRIGFQLPDEAGDTRPEAI